MRTNTARGAKGFTFIELLVAMALTLLLVAVIFGLFTTFRKAVARQEEIVEVQQVARIASDRLREYVMQIGRNTMPDVGQPMMIYASPYQMMFNADVEPETPWCKGREAIFTQSYNIKDGPNWQTVDFSYRPRSYHKNPPDPSSNDARIGFGSTAEMYRIYVYPDLGAARPASDYGTDTLHDRRILMQVNGNVATVPAADPRYPDDPRFPACIGATNYIGEQQELAYGVRWDNGTANFAYPNGERQKPLFMYWGDWDFNTLTPDELWGDNNCDGQLDKNEIANILSNGFTYTTCSGRTYSAANGARYGAIILNRVQCNVNGEQYTAYNTEDGAPCNGILESGEDLNRNRMLDRNLLDTQLHRIEINVTTVAKNKAKWEVFPNEGTIQTSVEPRNLNTTRVRTCGRAPQPVSISASATCPDVTITWSPSTDDGRGENDVVYYKILRSLVGSQQTTPVEPIATIPAGEEGVTTYSYVDTEVKPTKKLIGTEIPAVYQYQVVTYDCAGQSAGSNLSSLVSIPPGSGRVDGYKDYYLIAYDTACFPTTPGGDGSITLEFPALTNADSSLNETDYEYWIYRSKPFPKVTATTPVWDDVPIFKVRGLPNEGCGRGDPPPNWDWEDWCQDAVFNFKRPQGLPHKAGETLWYAVRDQWSLSRSGGEGGASLLPANGHMYGLSQGTSADAFNQESRYVYRVEVHRRSDQCEIANLTQHSPYREIENAPHPYDVNNTTPRNWSMAAMNYMDSQSFESYSGPNRETIFVPPMWGGGRPWDVNSEREYWATSIDDGGSWDDATGTFVPKYTLRFRPSKSERCADLAHPVEEYWIVRERWIRDENPTQPAGAPVPALRYSGQRVIFKKAKKIVYEGTQEYEFIDDPTVPGGTIPADWIYKNVWYSEDSCTCLPNSTETGCATFTAGAYKKPYIGGNIVDAGCHQRGGDGSAPPRWLSTSELPTALYTGVGIPRDLRPFDWNTSVWNPQAFTAASPGLKEVQLMYKHWYRTAGDANIHPLLYNRRAYGAHFEYYYYVVPVYRHASVNNTPANSAGGTYYSMAVSAPKQAPTACAMVQRPGVSQPYFSQCNYLDRMDIYLSFYGHNQSPSDQVVVEARQFGSTSEADWKKIAQSSFGSFVSPVQHYEIGAPGCQSTNHCWTPSIEYEYRVRVQGTGGSAECPMTWNLGRAFPGTPDPPILTPYRRDCVTDQTWEPRYLRVDVKPTGPYCYYPVGSNNRGDITTPPEYMWAEVYKEWRYPWEASPTDPNANWKVDEDYVNGGLNYRIKNFRNWGGDPLLEFTDDSGDPPVVWSPTYRLLDRHRYETGGIYPVNRQVRYRILVYADHNKNMAIERATLNNCFLGTPCDTGGGTTQAGPRETAWGRLCTPNGAGNTYYAANGSQTDNFTSLGFGFDGTVVDPRTWCADNFDHPRYALHDTASTYGCDQPFSTDCWEVCHWDPNCADDGCGHRGCYTGGAGLCRWITCPPEFFGIPLDFLSDFAEWLDDTFSSHMWKYLNDAGNYCAPTRGSSPPVPGNSAGGCLSSHQNWIGNLIEILNDLFGIFFSIHNAHFYSWNYWEGREYLYHSPQWCYDTGTTHRRREFENFTLAFHTKAKNGEDYNHLMSTAFLMREGSAIMFSDPTLYMAVNDFGKRDYPDWWPWGTNRPQRFYQGLRLRGIWHVIQDWINCGDPWCCRQLFSDAACNAINGLAAVPQEWHFGFREISNYTKGYDLDRDAHANLLLVCHESDPADGFSNTRMYYMTMHDPNWMRINNRLEDDIERRVFREAMLPPGNTPCPSSYNPNICPVWNSWQFNSGAWDISIHFYIDIPSWMEWLFGGDVDIELFSSGLDEFENKTGRVGWWFEGFDWMDFLGFEGTPTYAMDNMRIREYCGECPPQFIEGPGGLDQFSPSIFGGGTQQINMAAAGVRQPENSPFNAFYATGLYMEDLSDKPLYLNPKSLQDDPKYTRVGWHPFYYVRQPDGRTKNVLKVTGESLKKQLNWTDDRVMQAAMAVNTLKKAGLLPLTPEKIRYMKSTGRLPGR